MTCLWIYRCSCCLFKSILDALYHIFWENFPLSSLVPEFLFDSFLLFLSLLNFSFCPYIFSLILVLPFCVFLQLTRLPYNNYFEICFLTQGRSPFFFGSVTEKVLCSFGGSCFLYFFSCSLDSWIAVFTFKEVLTSSNLLYWWALGEK